MTEGSYSTANNSSISLSNSTQLNSSVMDGIDHNQMRNHQQQHQHHLLFQQQQYPQQHSQLYSELQKLEKYSKLCNLLANLGNSYLFKKQNNNKNNFNLNQICDKMSKPIRYFSAKKLKNATNS